ncbi:irregular chiasm C-roughest protein isoform X1 [Lepeophtheirus salmonis]|uniref:irregular chiasm C-roughest protein isoform X1 n=1 Tax=Lepeophtheirus salmonis TaxID=72036 RepID=UPI001AE6D705|nr:hemicentin-1-like isoform X1 [Lepeophtheirus salmonis]
MIALVILFVLHTAHSQQQWIEQPSYSEVNPGGSIIMKCIIANKIGECRWEKNGTPVGIYKSKYEWYKTPETGDCSLKIYDASLEFDDAVWQCQITASSFNSKDSLISDGAQLVVRESPKDIYMGRIGNGRSDEVVSSAGDDLELECTSEGGNPPPTLSWLLNGSPLESGHVQENTRSAEDSRTWISTSKLILPVNKRDNHAEIRCISEHPTLSDPMTADKKLNVHYPPVVTVETSPLEYLEEGKDSITLSCKADSNPPSQIQWVKEGFEGVFSKDSELRFSPVTRHTAGLYSCIAQNSLGLSEPSTVEVDVKYTPRILSVGPHKEIQAFRYNKTLLTCEAEGNPEPHYQWLQKTPTQEVLIRGYSKTLFIENITYDHQGEFVCKAINRIRGEERAVQSEPIQVQVKGAPQVIAYSSSRGSLKVRNGEDAILEAFFCADPLPKGSWHLGDLSGSGNNIILASGTGHGRFIAEKVREADREDCYISSLRINGAHASDSRAYELKVFNDHGSDNYIIHLNVGENIPQESMIAAGVGAILTILILILIIIYCVKANKCCCCRSIKDLKTEDVESDKTDIESTHSSNTSSAQQQAQHTRNNNSNNRKNIIIPPDALYLSKDKTYINYNDPIFNDSKESLRPDLVSHSTNLNRTDSSSGELHNISRVSYNDLCFPKTSNYGSMKKKSRRDVLRSINV